jgi:hypothetical protein
LIKQIGGSADFNYTVTATHDNGTVSNVMVTGTISVFNPNVDSSSNTVPVDIDGVTDSLSDGTVCSVSNGGAQTLTQARTDFSYSCSLSSLPQGQLNNVANVTWSNQTLTSGAFLVAGLGDFTFTDISFAENAIDECASVSDSTAGTLGLVCVGDANPTTFNYTHTFSVPQSGCQSYDNTALLTTGDTGATNSASQTVTVCGISQVSIDIKPGSYPNSINLKKDQTVTVAILGSNTLNVKDIITSPISSAPTFGPSNATPIHIAYSDVNKDGYLDLVLQYKAKTLGFTSSSTQGCITGTLSDATTITGCDSVRIVMS